MPEELPPVENWDEYNTMFKLLRPKMRAIQTVMYPEKVYEPTVQCVNCFESYPLKDLLEGELEEYQCPSCHVTVWEFWKDRKHQEVPEDA